MSDKASAEKNSATLPAVKLAPDVHQAIGLRKVREGGRIQDIVDAVLREEFAPELLQMKAGRAGAALEVVK